MITAKNYAEQAVPGLTKAIKLQRRRAPDWEMDHLYVDSLIDVMKDAVHFIVPDGGRIFDDDFKGLEGQEIRLPFPEITISYYVPDKEKTEPSKKVNGSLSIWEEETNVRKRIIIAREVELDTFPEDSDIRAAFKDMGDRVIVIDSVFELDKEWTADNGQILVSCSWEKARKKLNESKPESLEDKKAPNFAIFPVGRKPNLIRYSAQSLGRSTDDMLDVLANNLSGEMGTLLEFCEALTCSNVGFEKVERSKVRSLLGAKKKCRPSFETYTLTIDTPSIRKVYDDADQPEGSERKSPRQHLRRGHIRMLADGRRIWVNSCIVGSIANGKIKKDYEVKHDSL